MGISGKVFDIGINEEGHNLTNQIEKYVEELLRSDIDLRSFIVYGSRVKGDYKPYSDIDVVVVADNLPDGFNERWNFLKRLPYARGVEVHPYDSAEFLRAIEQVDMTALDSLAEGKVIYDDGFLKIARERFSEIQEKYELSKTPYGWRSLNYETHASKK